MAKEVPQTPFMTLMQERIRKRLEIVNKSHQKVALECGFARSYIRDFMHKRKGAPTSENIVPLAASLECDPAYLMGLKDSPKSIPVTGTVQSGAWRRDGTDHAGDILVDISDDHPERGQVAMIVRGDHWADAGIRDTTIVVAAPDAEAAPGDMVLVRATRESGAGTEFLTTIATRKGSSLKLSDADTDAIGDAPIEELGPIVLRLNIF